VKYTYNGDTNLDGVVNIDDYFAIDLAFANQVDGGWRTGDSDYSGGPPNADDYFLMDAAFLGQSAPLASGSPGTAAPTIVPEPLCLSAVIVWGSALSRRQRRRVARSADPSA
jgi:hypothetical protein